MYYTRVGGHTRTLLQAVLVGCVRILYSIYIYIKSGLLHIILISLWYKQVALLTCCHGKLLIKIYTNK
jgi:hypothetical protein